jgi:hypothetical protein
MIVITTEKYQRLINSYQIPLNPSKQKTQRIKIGTGFDFLSIYLLKNKDELGTLGLYEDENSRGKTKVKLA